MRMERCYGATNRANREAYNDILKPMEERMIALIRANVDDSQPSKILSKL